jgi:hypothetical protein
MGYGVLIVSGYEIGRRGMQGLLQRSEMPPDAIYEANSPDNAFSELERIVSKGGMIKVIVTDTNIGDDRKGGIRLLERIKADGRYAATPVIVVSGPDLLTGHLEDPEEDHDAVSASVLSKGAFAYCNEGKQELAGLVKEALLRQT